LQLLEWTLPSGALRVWRTRIARPSHPQHGRSWRGRGLTGVRRAPSCAACPVGDAAMCYRSGRRHEAPQRCGEQRSAQTRLDGACGLACRSGAACSANSTNGEGCQAQRGGDGRRADPWRASVARSAIKRAGVSDGRRRGETPSAARCAARQRDPASPGTHERLQYRCAKNRRARNVSLPKLMKA
jgi:hypothetical protein